MRLWWACRVHGYPEVQVLDGGLERWAAEDRPLSTERPVPRRARATPRPGEPLVCGAEEVAAAETEGDVVVVDTRPPEQFQGFAVWFERGPVPADDDGIARTPRGHLRAGRIPWARNIPAARLYREDGTFRRPEELRAILEEAGVHEGTRVITYCGVGISAAAGAFAARLAGIEDVALYDGSWEEWGREHSRPVARG
jgi:thiosulfate/3-mercaptopyruvate sulfurtransferase